MRTPGKKAYTFKKFMNMHKILKNIFLNFEQNSMYLPIVFNRILKNSIFSSKLRNHIFDFNYIFWNKLSQYTFGPTAKQKQYCRKTVIHKSCQGTFERVRFVRLLQKNYHFIIFPEKFNKTIMKFQIPASALRYSSLLQCSLQREYSFSYDETSNFQSWFPMLPNRYWC